MDSEKRNSLIIMGAALIGPCVSNFIFLWLLHDGVITIFFTGLVCFASLIAFNKVIRRFEWRAELIEEMVEWKDKTRKGSRKFV